MMLMMMVTTLVGGSGGGNHFDVKFLETFEYFLMNCWTKSSCIDMQ